MQSRVKALFTLPCSEAFMRFLRVYACFAVFIQFQGIFLNTYLIKATGTTQSVMVFNIVLAAIQPFVMLLAVMLIRKTSALFSQRVGLTLYAVVFLALCILGENAVAYIQLIAGLLSAAAGFFYTTYAMELLVYTTEKNRDACYGIQLALGSLIGLVIPLFTGLMISSFSGFTGYRVLFAAGFLITLLSLYFSMRLPPFRMANRQKQPELRRALHVLLHNKAARAAMTASAANGFYGGTMSFFLNMLMYSMIESEAFIGISTTACSIAAIAASAIYARVVRASNRERSVVISVGIMMAVTVLLVIRVSVAMIFVYGIILNMLAPFFCNPPMTAYVGVVEHLPSLEGLSAEVHALREFWYGAGRVLGILLTLALYDRPNGAAMALLVIIAVQIIPAALMKQMESRE